jgi:hypothetical protein
MRGAVRSRIVYRVLEMLRSPRQVVEGCLRVRLCCDDCFHSLYGLLEVFGRALQLVDECGAFLDCQWVRSLFRRRNSPFDLRSRLLDLLIHCVCHMVGRRGINCCRRDWRRARRPAHGF